ncbi:hypothetical protein [Pseudomonas poae]|uniref:Uncharacterized protein n=1 Tax=Pseudomonas poae TaxID=200451 RepID=A0ABY0RD72_9PSED|nr:hypothetical protein [Pseudomonas poae]KRP46115.1 hypothetical protein TU75_20180 [Pseudomonas poae]SDN71637.1 hypothetical protein SAMN04490208_1228 [Pseudomonas poae]
MDDYKKATCYYRYEIEGKEKAGQIELPEKLKHPDSRYLLHKRLIGTISGDEPGYFLQTPQQHQTSHSGYLAGPANIVFGWIEFERGLESGAIDEYSFYRKDRLPKL